MAKETEKLEDKQRSGVPFDPVVRFDDDSEIYPCDNCGEMRSKNQGGTIFTVCDNCWDRIYR